MRSGSDEVRSQAPCQRIRPPFTLLCARRRDDLRKPDYELGAGRQRGACLAKRAPRVASRLGRGPLLDLFVGIDAPQHDLSYVTLESVAIDQTPGSVATANVRDNSRLQRCDNLRACRGPHEYFEILSLLA